MSSKQLFFNNHLMRACVAAVFAFGLAACSSSNDQQSTGPTDPPPTAAAEKTAITNAIAAAKMAVDGLTAESLDADVETANAAITAAHNAIAGAEHASAADTVANIAELDAIRTSFATARTAIDEHRAELAAQRQAAIEAKIKEVDTKLTAMNQEAAQTIDAGLGGTGATIGTSEGNYSLDIEYGSATVTVHGATADADEKFVQAMDLGGGLTMHTRSIEATETADAMQEVAMVMTDIEAPVATAFGKVHTLDVRADGEAISTTKPADALNVATANLQHVKASAFVTPAGTIGTATLSFQHAVTGENPKAAAEIMGTYEGATGTYKCAADAACTVTVNGEGTVSGVSNDNDWIFIPADGAEVDVADTAFLHYGFWLKKSTDSDGVVTYNEVETFAGATGLGSRSTGTINGTASYRGGAMGVYVRHVYSEGGGKIASSAAGHFTADANLKANFGGNDVPVNIHNTITGTIDNFVLSGGEASDWSVDLEGTIDLTSTTPDFSGKAKGGVGDGDLDGHFYGDADTLPAAATGEFNATMNNGAVAGAFGLNKVDK